MTYSSCADRPEPLDPIARPAASDERSTPSVLDETVATVSLTPATVLQQFHDNDVSFINATLQRLRFRSGALVSIGEVTLRRARLVLGWATPSRCATSHQGQLSLAVRSWAGALNTSINWEGDSGSGVVLAMRHRHSGFNGVAR